MDRFNRYIHLIFLACALSVLDGNTVSANESLFPEIPARAGLSQQSAELSSQLIIRWEVGSQARYTRLYQGVIWPGGASGPTWGIGYDGGHQSPVAIKRDWSALPSKHVLALTAGVTGQRARLSIARWRGITTPFSYAKAVFTDRTLPAYALQARRTLGQDFEAMPDGAQAALFSLGYNRGWSMLGTRNTEKRVIRDVCIPARDSACVAQQLRAMCHIWQGTPNYDGLCNRRKDEARVAVQI